MKNFTRPDHEFLFFKKNIIVSFDFFESLWGLITDI